jgi:hypothetical protein
LSSENKVITRNLYYITNHAIVHFMNWPINLTKIAPGNFRSINGNADEMIGVGRCMKAGFPCSRVDITNGKYDAIVDVDTKRLLRIQIKGTGNGVIGFTGGTRSGQQISREAASRKYKYSAEDCDIILGVDGTNGECYIIPVDDIQAWGNSKKISALSEYKENWNLLIKTAKKLNESS